MNNLNLNTVFGVTVGSGGAPHVFILDEYPTGVEHGFSFQLLRSAYTGPLFVAKRVSDNATQAFYPNGSFQTNTADLISFSQGGDVVITTWYNQTINNWNFTNTQTTRGFLVQGGVLVTDSDNNMCLLNGVSGNNIQLDTFGVNPASKRMTYFSQVAWGSASNNIVGYGVGSPTTFYAGYNSNISYKYFFRDNQGLVQSGNIGPAPIFDKSTTVTTNWRGALAGNQFVFYNNKVGYGRTSNGLKIDSFTNFGMLANGGKTSEVLNYVNIVEANIGPIQDYLIARYKS